MKLAEALIIRADLQKQIYQLKNRLVLNSKVQEGEEASENPHILMTKLSENISELQDLIYRINMTNSTYLVDGKPITYLMAQRETLLLKIDTLRAFLDNASRTVDRYSNKEIKIVSTVNVTEIQAKVDVLSKEYRLLDAKIQSVNWQADLVENV